jgi:site-specific recombinase XerD
LGKILAGDLVYTDVSGANDSNPRHTFATHHVAQDISLRTIQEIMGHQDIRTTEAYISLANNLSKQELEENAL